MLKIIFIPLSIIFLSLLQDAYCLEPVRNYIEQISFISSLSNKFSSEVIGRVNYENKVFPIYKISYNKVVYKIQQKYLVVCGVHGNEPAPVFAVREYLLELETKQVKKKDVTVDFIYIVNPWGFVYNQRYNGKNEEINRDLETLKTQEAKILNNNLLPSEYE